MRINMLISRDSNTLVVESISHRYWSEISTFNSSVLYPRWALSSIRSNLLSPVRFFTKEQKSTEHSFVTCARLLSERENDESPISHSKSNSTARSIEHVCTYHGLLIFREPFVHVRSRRIHGERRVGVILGDVLVIGTGHTLRHF